MKARCNEENEDDGEEDGRRVGGKKEREGRKSKISARKRGRKVREGHENDGWVQ